VAALVSQSVPQLTEPPGRLRWWVLKHILDRKLPREEVLERMPTHSVGAEIGVWTGDFSALILRAVAPRVLHLIDPWKYEPDPEYAQGLYGGLAGNQAKMDLIHDLVQRRFERHVASGAVRIHRSSSVEAAATFPDGYFDWVYIDGNHQYEFVKRDLESFYPKVKTGGLIAGDDYGNRGWWADGVTKAVNEFILGSHCDVVVIEHNQFVLRKKEQAARS
jgi:Methyltransferase domain